ncbi:Exosome complex component CSL4 [Porphyridium purpureum]|uniref:Exosome complex component CSL4 n=1 Tax=Porphyridium purpureum TaxID=35688 RepID=A0A5J4YM18_PORPP|nr:Exosome complex component CSL4 [Porphyridium purpureum]|eukprot:POR7311..scf295_9
MEGQVVAPGMRVLVPGLLEGALRVVPDGGINDGRAERVGRVVVVEEQALRLERSRQHAVCPAVGRRATGRVTRVNNRMAVVEILAVDQIPVSDGFRGLIRQQDVRQAEVDSVQMYKSFMPGDIVETVVVSLGDRAAYYLSTATNELGVVHAFCPSCGDTPMHPLSWVEMGCVQCPSVLEFRKVAKRPASAVF